MTTATEPVPEVVEAPVDQQATPVDGNPAGAVDSTQTSKVFDPEALPAEIKSYVSKREEEVNKKYADYDRHVQAAREWEGVRNDPRFQEWARSLNQPQKPKAEITDEQFSAAFADKNQMAALIRQQAEALLAERFGPELEKVKIQNDFNAKVTELQQTVKDHPDFKDLDKRGLIEPIIRKYPNMNFEDAYKMAKYSTMNEEADRRARGIIDSKKKASVERPGPASGARSPKVSAKNREEAMTMVMEAARAGRPIPEFDEIGD